jgi:flagellar basal-body rod modification protein FlgD
MELSQTASQTVQTQPANTSGADPSLISSDFDTFLKMMTAQIKNQDPLDPMDSADFSTQLATFSGVEQQVQTNDLLKALGVQMGNLGMAQLASWIGMEARTQAPAYFDGSPVNISPNIATGADSAILVVKNDAGTEVQRIPFDATRTDLQWAGVGDNGTPFTNGLYKFDIESYSGDDLLGTSNADTYSKITEAKSRNGETILVLSGGSEVSASEISALRTAG